MTGSRMRSLDLTWFLFQPFTNKDSQVTADTTTCVPGLRHLAAYEMKSPKTVKQEQMQVCDKVVCESAMSATPATQNDGGGEFVPRLPGETKVDVRLCHACHAKCRGVTGAKSGPKGATQYHKCHACHAKRRWM